MSQTDQDLLVLIQVIAETLGIEPAEVTASTRVVEDLGIDSLDITAVALELEYRLGREINLLSEPSSDPLITVRDLHKRLLHGSMDGAELRVGVSSVCPR